MRTNFCFGLFTHAEKPRTLSITAVKDFEWDMCVGHTHRANFKYDLSEMEQALAIDVLRTDSVNAFQAELIADLESQGFIKDESGRNVPAVTYITKEENARFFEIESEAGKAFCHTCLEDTECMTDLPMT